jgi:NAD(P)H-flavin reductase
MGTTAASPRFMCKLEDRQEVAEGTMAFRFDKPLGWTFEAGQHLDMTLLDPSETDSEGNVRSFTIASAPHEKTLTIPTGGRKMRRSWQSFRTWKDTIRSTRSLPA